MRAFALPLFELMNGQVGNLKEKKEDFFSLLFLFLFSFLYGRVDQFTINAIAAKKLLLLFNG